MFVKIYQSATPYSCVAKVSSSKSTCRAKTCFVLKSVLMMCCSVWTWHQLHKSPHNRKWNWSIILHESCSVHKGSNRDPNCVLRAVWEVCSTSRTPLSQLSHLSTHWIHLWWRLCSCKICDSCSYRRIAASTMLRNELFSNALSVHQ